MYSLVVPTYKFPNSYFWSKLTGLKAFLNGFQLCVCICGCTDFCYLYSDLSVMKSMNKNENVKTFIRI